MSENIIKIAIISDLHYALMPNIYCPERRGEFIVAILAKMVKKLNREVKPDLVLVGGDLINFPEAEEAERLTSIIADILSLLDMPYIVIRGNHDIKQEKFVQYFPFKSVSDIGFVRIIAFDDAEMPGYNAHRSLQDLQKMKDFSDFDGVKFSFQHTPVVPVNHCIYSYDNAEEILEVMKKYNYKGALSGHFHEGIKFFQEDNLQFFVQNALCESPFAASILHVSRNGIEKVEVVPV